MRNPVTIHIIYPDGDPENMRIAKKRNWPGKVFCISCNFWTEGIRRYHGELEVPGIYILVGKNKHSDDGRKIIYIGQAENLRTRVEQHFQDQKKSFFQNIVCVTASGGFNNAHFRWMESYLIQQAQEIDRCDLQNSITPRKPQIEETEVVDVKRFLEETIEIFPLVKIGAFVAPQYAQTFLRGIDPSTSQKIATSEIFDDRLALFKSMLECRFVASNGMRVTIAECLRHGYWPNGKFIMVKGRFVERPLHVQIASQYGFAMGSATEMWVAPKHLPMRDLLTKKYRNIDLVRYFKDFLGIKKAMSPSGETVRISCNYKNKSGCTKRSALAIPESTLKEVGFISRSS